MKNEKLKIIFLGTPEFGAIILEKLAETNFKPILVITAPDKPVGRKQILTLPPVKVIAQKYKIPILQPDKILDSKFKNRVSIYGNEGEEENEVLLALQDSKPDLIIVAAYGQILPKEILDIPKRGSLNVHPSLLPKYRGASPIQYAILNGDKKTGVTIMLMDEKMDRGPILNQRTLEIEKDETSTTLHRKLANLGAGLLMETISKWMQGMIKPRPQDDAQATYTKILTREDGKINWKKTAKDLEQEIRAFDYWPGSFTFWEKRDGTMVRIKILKARVLESKGGITYSIGKTLVVPQNEIGVQCRKGFLEGGGDFLVIEKLQIEGKKEIGSEEFLRGYPDFIGTTFK